jgi:hypothetical protein
MNEVIGSWDGLLDELCALLLFFTPIDLFISPTLVYDFYDFGNLATWFSRYPIIPPRVAMKEGNGTPEKRSDIPRRI